MLAKLEKATSDLVKEIGGDNACRQLSILFAIHVDDVPPRTPPPTYCLPTRSFGDGVASVLVASQTLLQLSPIEHGSRPRPRDDDFANLTLRVDRKPFVQHFREHRLSPYALDGEMAIYVKADLLAGVLGPLVDPRRASITLLRFDWSEHNADEIVVTGKRISP